jgi:hypothetical protein
MPVTMPTPPASCTGPSGLPKSTTPIAAPNRGSRLRKAPATSAVTRLCAKANSVVGATVPASTRAAVASMAVALPPWTATGRPASAAGSTATAAAMSCTAVTAIGSRPRSNRAWHTVNPAEASCPASTSPSPPKLDPPPRPPAMRPTPASDRANPAHATGRATPRPVTAAMTATSTGVAPMSSAACVTLVRSMPRFCSRTEPP